MMKKEHWVERYKGDEELPSQRDDFERDRARIVHDPAFRRLQGKTQLIAIGETDYHRTRLTHSIEVSQIADGIRCHIERNFPDQAELQETLPSRYLLEAICFAHDLGHPPFGHAGEKQLDYMMRDNGGFEGNGQTLRILTRKLKSCPVGKKGLTRRTLMGVLKYPVSYQDAVGKRPVVATSTGVHPPGWLPPKCYLNSESEVVEFLTAQFTKDDRELFFSVVDYDDGGVLKKKYHKTLDCQIMDVADELAYTAHDLEDLIAHGIVSRSVLESALVKEDLKGTMSSSDKSRLDSIVARLFQSIEDDRIDPYHLDDVERRAAISDFIDMLISNVDVSPVKEFSLPLLRFKIKIRDEVRIVQKAILNVVKQEAIFSRGNVLASFRGDKIIADLYNAASDRPGDILYPAAYKRYEEGGDSERKRVVCDHVAGMTDSYALRMHTKLFGDRSGGYMDIV